jgi:hypothetical protein
MHLYQENRASRRSDFNLIGDTLMIEGTTDPRNVKIQYFFNFKLIKSCGMMINNIYFYRRGVYSVILKLK